jgi:sugar phosphate isomerase/epimerase
VAVNDCCSSKSTRTAPDTLCSREVHVFIKRGNDMKREFSLAHLTAIGCAPPEMTYMAARAGYDYVSLRLIPMGIPGENAWLPQDKAMIKQTRAALRETGVKLLDLELARIVADVDPGSYLPAMEVAAELGAGHVISSAWTTDRTDRDFIIERYREICDLADQFGLKVSLEFPTFSRITNLQEAVDIVEAADRPNSGILIDTLYLHYSRVGLDELEKLPRKWLHFMHICDVDEPIPETVDGMKAVAREGRLYPGEGCIDFGAIMKIMPNIPLSIELPNSAAVKKYGYEKHAALCLKAARELFGRIDQALTADRVEG